MRYIGIFVILLSIFLPISIMAAPLEEALSAAKRKDFEKAVRLIRPLAERGNPEAQYFLGEMYDQGLGVERDIRGNRRDWSKAADWFEKAAAQGHAGAQHNLGVYHYYGWGVAKDEAAALKWLELAVETALSKAEDPTNSKALILKIRQAAVVENTNSQLAETACVMAAAEKLPRVPGLEIRGSTVTEKQPQRTGGGLPGWVMLVALDVRAVGKDITYTMACAHIPGQRTMIEPVR